MKIEVRGRQTGKTTRAIELAIKTEAWLLVPSAQDVQQLKRLHPNLNVMGFEQALQGMLRGRFNPKVVIDNADMLLQQILPGVSILAVTMTDALAVTEKS
jgi:hypothetical protein